MAMIRTERNRMGWSGMALAMVITITLISCSSSSRVTTDVGENLPTQPADSMMMSSTDAEQAGMAHKQIGSGKQMLNNPTEIIKLNVGPAWITSDIEAGGNTYKSLSGFKAEFDYQHLWDSGFGFGMNYMYYGASLNSNYDMRMHYIGPSFVSSMIFGYRWRFEGALGLGYSSLTENAEILGTSSSKTEYGLGIMSHLGIEYMVSPKIGIGFQIGFMSMKLKQPKGFDMKKYDFYGIRRVDLGIGLRIYP